MKTNGLTYSLALLLGAAAAAPAAKPSLIERGRHLIATSGCNDCHTPAYMQLEGRVPEPAWLTGSDVGFQGPWGTTYPANLRLRIQQLTEAQWLQRARQPMRPPMPWFGLREMSDQDLRAIYQYIRAAGPAGKPTPDALPPGVAVTTPYIDFTPHNLPAKTTEQQALK